MNMSTTATIRTAHSADLEPLADLLKMLFAIEEDFSFDRNKQLNGLKMLLGNPSACILVADLGGEVVGMCSGQILISTAEGGVSVLVEDVVVRKEYRGLGIGTRLMTEICRFAEKSRATRLQLLADKDNGKAIEFYEKNGWSRTNMFCLNRKL